MATRKDIEFEFIKQALAGYGKQVVPAMEQAIKKMKIEDELALLRSLDFKVKGTLFELYMKDYGPFQDMGVGRGYGLKVSNENRRAKLTRRKPRKFYSPVAYGYLNSLIGKLQYGLTEDVVDSIKAQLEGKV